MLSSMSVPSRPAFSSANQFARESSRSTTRGAACSDDRKNGAKENSYDNDSDCERSRTPTKLQQQRQRRTGAAELKLAGAKLSLKLIEKSVIIYKDENGFGLRLKSQTPVFVEHVHENGAAWRAGVRRLDTVSRVNGTPVSKMNHRDVVLMFKSCTRFVALTLLSQVEQAEEENEPSACGESSSLFKLEPTAGRRLPAAYLVDRSCSFSAGARSRQLLSGCQPMATSSGGDDDNAPGRGNLSPSGSSATRHFSSASMRLQRSEGAADLQPLSTKLCRQDSNEQQDAEKRLAVCVCSSSISSNQTSTPSSPIGAGLEGNDTDSAARNQLESFVCTKCSCAKSKSFYTNPKQQLLIGSHRLGGGSVRSHNLGHVRGGGTCDESAAELSAAPDKTENTSDRNHSRQFIKLSQSASSNSLPVSSANGCNLAAKQKLTLALSPAADCQSKTVNKRLEIIREFINTEQTHTERLRCLDELFYRPLKHNNMITKEQLRMVFSCHWTLYKIHRQIYRTLLSAVDYGQVCAEPLIGSALLEIFEGELKRRLERAACAFCSAQATNVELLNKLTRRDTKVGLFIAEVSREQMIGRLGVKDLLASCFQRLTKYPLLLENLLKATPDAPPPQPNEEEVREKPVEEAPENLTGGSDDDDEAAVAAQAYESARRNSRRMLAISLAEEREFIERALVQSRSILSKVNEAITVAVQRNRLKEIWKRTDKRDVPLPEIKKQQVVHEGLLTLRLAKRSFDVYVLLLNDYIILLTRDGHDKYRLKFFTPDGKSIASGSQQSVYSPVFVIDEHLTTRDAATDENGFYLLCKRKDDSRIYEFASRSPAERIKWRDKIQLTIENQIRKINRRPSEDYSVITKSSSGLSTRRDDELGGATNADYFGGPNRRQRPVGESSSTNTQLVVDKTTTKEACGDQPNVEQNEDSSYISNKTTLSPKSSQSSSSGTPTKIAGTISYVENDGIIMPYKMESFRAIVGEAIQVNLSDEMKQ